ncbi:nucleotidyltransferase [Agrobacterium rubi]|uniref:nucleotidyltransferase domain-containing protein n=1 Tax=Agrobacterium rubi TaxID=28099 RepID=UPI001572C9AD|nr:nucleotidyltransferase [Agrobacterium rubi]NTF08008.1 nucleotidyltransferase [Agrobacterium rubi]NTF20236.1 nucleotidyltransferase [Agrobacterium rubi]NTF27207.1 nucleotidyltransferase [Agrobacterium rubi]
MNVTTSIGVNPFLDPIDRMLAEIAFSIQLPPSLHAKAVSRYEAVRKYLEGTVAFHDGVEHFYPQGSMAIDATISTRGTDDEYDIDIIAQLGGRFRNMEPLDVLKELEEALDGYRGLKVSRQTRCMTLHYADNMHLDISPVIRQYSTPERQSWIMNARGPGYSGDDCIVPTNAFAFVEWYRNKTPNETIVRDAFHNRWLDEMRIRADAEVDDVPDQTHFGVKSMATLALQLIKRYRNIRYSDPRRSGRMPPSVMLAYYAAKTSRPGQKLTEALDTVCSAIIADIQMASSRGNLLHVENPEYRDDVFTDRWPETVMQQNLFAHDLGELVTAIRNMRNNTVKLTEFPEVLKDLFGDHVVTSAIHRVAVEHGNAIKGATQTYTNRGGLLTAPALIVPATPAASKTLSSVKPTSHTFFGDAP